MATANMHIRGFKYVPAYQNDEGLIVMMTEAASQTWLRGALLILSSGKLAQATETSHALDGSQILVGFAQDDATGVTDAPARVRVIRPNDLYMVNYQSDDTFATADVGSEFGLYDEGGANGSDWRVNQDETTAKYVTVLASGEWGPELLNATAGGTAYVKFIESTTFYGETD